jgi:hypothetical protein
MSTDFGHTDLLQAFIKVLEGQVETLPGIFDEKSLGKAPARLKGLLVGLRQHEVEIARDFIKRRGALVQECISKGNNSTFLDSKMTEFGREKEIRYLQVMGNWFEGLSIEEKTTFEKYCLTITADTLQPLFPPGLPACLRGPFARLALEHTAISRRYADARKQTELSCRNRGLLIALQSLLEGLTHCENEAKSNVIGRWLRELTPEQATALDTGEKHSEAAESSKEAAQAGEAIEASSHLPPSREKAFRQYLQAVSNNPTQLNGATDREVYDWLEVHSEGERLPRFDTWSRYLREARDHYSAQKNTARTGRVTGKSVVSEDEIDRRERE